MNKTKYKYISYTYYGGNSACPVCARDWKYMEYKVTKSHECICALCVISLEKSDPDFACGLEAFEDKINYDKLVRKCAEVAISTYYKFNPTYSLAA